MHKEPSEKELQIFGLTLGGILLLLSHLFLRREHFGASKFCVIAGLIVFVTALFLPRSIRFIQGPWMIVATKIGDTVTAIILAIVYYVFIMPYILLLRLCGVGFFHRFPKKAASYWIDKKPWKLEGLKRYERQF